MRTRLPAPLVLATLAFAASTAGAEDFHLFSASVPASHYLSQAGPSHPDGFDDLDLAAPSAWPVPEGLAPRIDLAMASGLQASDEPVAPPATAPKLLTTPTVLVAGGVLFLGAVYAMTSPWNHGFRHFQFYDEHFFGPNTYAGGADKCSHFVVSATISREMALVFDAQGHTEAQSTALAFGLSVFTGFLVEMGDGLSPYGFSWEDLTADALGTTAGLLLTRYGLNDLIGLRAGKVPTEVPELPGHEASLGSAYSTELYSADLKIAGLAKRLHFQPGPARFLLTSVTYNTKGYGYVPPFPDRQRLVGFELGLNLPEILTAVGVEETTWWGSFLHKALNFFRIPFTSFGFRYDLNHGRWHGPDSGTVYY